MSPKMLRQIIAVLLGAVVGWGLLASWQRQKQQADNRNALTVQALSPSGTDTIRYLGPNDTIILARAGDRWTVNGLPAGQPVVDAFFRSAADTSARSELISESAASHERLGVDSVRGKHLVAVGGGKTVLDLWFGNRGPDFDGFYVRAGDDPRVFLLKGNFANLSIQPLEDWRDRTIVAIGRDSIGHLEIARGRGKYQVTRASSDWKVGNGIADSTAIARLLGSFTSLRSTGFPRPEQVDSAKFNPAERQVWVYNLTGSPMAHLELDSMSWGWMVRSAGALYKLDQRMVDQLTPAMDSILRR